MSHSLIQTKFKLIAALAEIASTKPHDWASNIQQTAEQIRREASDIAQLARDLDRGDL